MHLLWYNTNSVGDIMLYKGELVPLNLILDEEVKLRYDWQAVKIEKDNGKR